MSKIASKLVKGTNNLYKGVPQTVNKVDKVTQLYREAMFQKEIIKWNEEYVGKKRTNGEDIMKAMSKVQFSNGAVIVQLYRQDFIPNCHVITSDSNKIKSWRFAPPLIDVRRHATDPESLAVNPIPTIYKGIIVGIAPDVQLSYLRKQEEMRALGMDLGNYSIPEVGDTVYLSYFMTKDMRFYINKQEKELDIVITPENYSIENFDYTFKVTEFHIESIVKPNKAKELADAVYTHRDFIMSVNKPEDIHNIFEINENWEV
jgi:hypothetical protein